MKYLLLSVLVVCMIGVMILSAFAQDSEIPAWIKNNAGWWADDQIDDVSFLKGIEYLLDNLIIQIPSNQQITPNSGLLQLDKFAYELPKRSGTTEVNISGKFENWSGSSVSIDITRPDGKIDELSTRSSTGSFEYAYIIKSDFPLGNYQLSAKSVNVQLGMVSFKLNAQSDQSEKSIPVWVRNNAGWWADGQIDDSSFVSGLQFLIKEGIIKVQYKKVDKNASFAPGIDEKLIMYQTKLPTAVVSKGVFSAIVIHATHNDYCSAEENKLAAAYGKMTEHLLKKTIRENPTQVLAVCMKLDVIKESSYPLTLKELGANRSSIMIFVGDLEANFESYMVNDALGWWKCEADYTSKWAFKGCGTHIIVVCDECTRDDFPDPKDTTTNGMVILAHEIGHHNLFEDGFGPGVWSTSLHNAQFAIDYCDEGNVLPSNMCKKLKEPVTIMGKTYPVMNINFIKNQWKKIDIIMEEDKMTSWFDCKRSNYENGITRICGPGISSTQDSSEDNVQPTQRDLATEQKVPESIQNLYVKNPRMVNEFGASVAKVTVGQQVQIAVDATNKQDRYQAFAYVVQMRDDKGILISDAWITGTLNVGQSISPALAWTPKAAGHYTATIYLYETMKNRILLAEPLTLEINVVSSSVLMPSSSTLPYFGAIVELDKVVYSWTDGVWIAVTAPNFNSDPNKIDYIGDKPDSRITITSTNGKTLDFFKLEETGIDTGVFIGHVLLTGFSYDADGDGKDDPVMFRSDIAGETFGNGPWAGFMKAEPGNVITVKFSEKYSGSTNTHEAKAEVEFWLAELSWQSSKIKFDKPVTVTVVDEDMNLGFFNRDSLSVHVYSDSDADGFQLLLTETEILDDDGTSFPVQDSGIFEGQIKFTNCSAIDQQRNICTPHPSAKVFATPGDTITVEYTDCTLPTFWTGGDCLTLSSETKIAK